MDDPKHPLWHTHKEAPKELYIGFYLGLAENWVTTSVGYDEDPIKFICAQLDRPTRILKYQLVEDEEFTDEDREKYRKTKPWDRAKKPIKVRKVRKVKCQT